MRRFFWAQADFSRIILVCIEWDHERGLYRISVGLKALVINRFEIKTHTQDMPEDAHTRWWPLSQR